MPPFLPCPQVCKYIDIPLQHISNLTLLAMNRPPQVGYAWPRLLGEEASCCGVPAGTATWL